jgi:hypothetical protein
MLDPKILSGVCIGLPPMPSSEIEKLFNQTAAAPNNVFWLVRWQGEERGVVMMRQVSIGWEPHLCLSTQRPHTREVMREIFLRVRGSTIVFYFCVLNTRMERLADDLGFGPPKTTTENLRAGSIAPWCTRILRV